jgi:hypothetical protein
VEKRKAIKDPEILEQIDSQLRSEDAQTSSMNLNFSRKNMTSDFISFSQLDPLVIKIQKS